MTQSTTIEIPDAIKNLPIVSAAKVYNGHGSFMAVQYVTPANLSYAYASGYELQRDDCDSNPCPSNIYHYNEAQIREAYKENSSAAIGAYTAAIAHQKDSKDKLYISGAIAVASVVFAGVAVEKGKAVSRLTSCATGTYESINDARCLSDVYNQSRTDLENETIGAGVGFAVLAVAALTVLGLARRNAIESKVDFVKAALAQGNADMCKRILDVTNDKVVGGTPFEPSP